MRLLSLSMCSLFLISALTACAGNQMESQNVYRVVLGTSQDPDAKDTLLLGLPPSGSGSAMDSLDVHR